MVKTLVLLLLFCGISFANEPQNTEQEQNLAIPLENPVDYRVMQLLGGDEYRINQKFIQRLFKNQAYFLDSKKEPDLYKISKTLKQNGLLKLSFKEPRELEIAFSIKDNPQVFISSLYDVLNEMGYYYFLVKQSIKDEKGFKFVLSMNTEYAIDPTLFQEKLREFGYYVQSIERTNLTQWNYVVIANTFKNPKAIELPLGQMVQKANLKGEYLYKISGAKSIEITSSNGVLWYPKLVFFDENFKILEIINTSKATRNITKEIAKNAAFLKVSDIYLPIAIKNGLDVILK